MKFVIWMILGILFFIFEIVTPAMFFFTSLSIGFFIAGFSTFITSDPIIQWLVFIVFSVISILVIKLFVKKNQDRPVRLANVDSLRGKKGLVLMDIPPDQGQGLVKVDGEEWRAVSDQEIKKGEQVRVMDIEGTHLIVKKTP